MKSQEASPKNHSKALETLDSKPFVCTLLSNVAALPSHLLASFLSQEPPRETVPRQTAARDTAPREPAPREPAPRDTVQREATRGKEHATPGSCAVAVSDATQRLSFARVSHHEEIVYLAQCDCPEYPRFLRLSWACP